MGIIFIIYKNGYLLSYKVDSKQRKLLDREGHSIIIKWLIHQGDIVILNVYAPKKKDGTYEAKSNSKKIERRNRPIHNCSWKL